ncbi:cellulase family glycosylhydrolase [Nannocystis radixulma]|uniref:Cellulase family glycosylhydrolase n=1 Tax=Nannocystis radixulma TaxID=2995305 RepID=A0ABT5B5I4_9BACT|nr:cellulase family glycosylhydrolase [Nannocystis radixulma]MDC0668774.1 cellulase family glycosylhydrolase [Nannocystis radixulma]
MRATALVCGLLACQPGSGGESTAGGISEASAATSTSTSGAGTTMTAPTTGAESMSSATDTSSGQTSMGTSTGETSTSTSTTGGPEVPAGSTIPVGGEDYFLLGANYPWLNYGGDFGGNDWGVYGVHTKQAEVGAHFDAMQGYGLRVARWFVFTDGRAGISFAGDGTPTGLGEHVLEDMNEAVAIARARGIYLVPVLLDFHWMFWAQQNGGVQTGGRSDCLRDPSKRAALIDAVIVPLLQAFADEPAILAWEIMNEPEWSIADLPAASPDGGADAVPLADFYAFAAAVADAVHANTSAYVTLGSASLKWYRVWTPGFAAAHGFSPLELDFYQTHYYPWMDNQAWNGDPELGTVQFSPTAQMYADLGLDRPMVVSEFIASDQASARLDVLLANGYAGAWPWSLTSDYSLDGPGMQAWAEAHATLVGLPPL